MKRWKKTGRQRRKMQDRRWRKGHVTEIRDDMRHGKDIGRLWGWLPGSERIRRRPVQKARHAKAQARRERRVWDSLVREWTDAGHAWPIAESLTAAEFDRTKREGWRVGRRGWWKPKR